MEAAAPHTVDGKQLDIKSVVAKGPDGQPIARSKKIFVGGLAPMTTQETLRNYFGQWGPVCGERGCFVCVDA